MRILLLGAAGQVGWQLRRSLALLGEVVALDRRSQPWCGDLARHDALAETVRALAPRVIVNAAAYTAVDAAQADPAGAHAINAEAVAVLAREAERLDAWLVHYSSDYVYDGSGERPWREDDPPAPRNVYGASKLAGDLAAAAWRKHLVLRTSWVFDAWGRNFLKSILRAAAQRDELTVVADQWGAPTRAALIADATAWLLRGLQPAQAGIYHLAADGATNWHGYAELAIAHARACGVALRASRVRPIASHEYPAPAPRPANSRLDTGKLRQTFGLVLPPWQDGVRAVVSELAAHGAIQ